MTDLFHLALYQPQIPGNTGNIGRLCVGFRCHLHVIGPCAFDFSDKAVRRAGLDYWPDLRLTVHADPAAFLAWLGERQPWLVTKFGAARFDRAAYTRGDVLILGNEVRGLPADWHARWPTRTITIPLLGPIRSFNLTNAAAMVLGQALTASGVFDSETPLTPPGVPPTALSGARPDTVP